MKAVAAAALALTGVQALYIAPPVLQERQQNTVHYESDYQNTVHYESDYQQTSSIDYRTVHYETYGQDYQTTSTTGPSSSSRAAGVTSSGSAAAGGSSSRPTSAAAAVTSSASRAAGSGSATAAGSRTTAIVAPLPTAIPYRCPSGFTLGYVENDVTFAQPLSSVASAFGNWSTSPFFNGSTAINSTIRTVVFDTQINQTETLLNFTNNVAGGIQTYVYTSDPSSLDFVNGTAYANYTSSLSFFGKAALGSSDDSTAIVYYTNFCTNNLANGTAFISRMQKDNVARFANIIKATPALATDITRSFTARATRMVRF